MSEDYPDPDYSDPGAIQARLDRALALLREVEWACYDEKPEFCPCCGCSPEYDRPFAELGDKGHAPDCKLKALLEETGDE